MAGATLIVKVTRYPLVGKNFATHNVKMTRYEPLSAKNVLLLSVKNVPSDQGYGSEVPLLKSLPGMNFYQESYYGSPPSFSLTKPPVSKPAPDRVS